MLDIVPDLNKILSDLDLAPFKLQREYQENLLRLAARGTALVEVEDSAPTARWWRGEKKTVPCKLFSDIAARITKFEPHERVALYGAFINGYAFAEADTEALLCRRVGRFASFIEKHGKDTAATITPEYEPGNADIDLLRRLHFCQRAIKVFGGRAREIIFDPENSVDKRYRLASLAFRTAKHMFVPTIVPEREIPKLVPPFKDGQQSVQAFGYIIRRDAAPQMI